MRDTAKEARMNIFLWTLHMDTAVLADQQELKSALSGH